MNLLGRAKGLCRDLGVRPSRSKGQNFLISERIYNKIIEESGIGSKDKILEVGPGPGFMTVKLASKAGKVMAVELDDKMAEALKEFLKNKEIKNARVVNRDIMDLELPPRELGDDYKVVANLPYNITSVFLRKFLSDPGRPESMVLLLQKEVAERITAEPPHMSLLALSVRYYGEPFFVKKVSAANFWPRPRVDSAIVRIKVRSKFLCDRSEEEDFFRLIRAGFSSKRKMLKNNLVSNLGIKSSEAESALKEAGLNPGIRPQELSLNDWVKLKEFLKYIYEEK